MENHGFRRRIGVLLGCLFSLGGAARGEESLAWGGRVDDGRLSVLEGSWAGDGAEARWWWRAEDPGAGWVRLGGLQVGPLVGAQAPEGERAWRPGTRVSSGHWGLDWDLGPAEVWGVQSPEAFEAGTLLRAHLGPWSSAASAQRTWAFDGGPGEDRFRFGLGWAGDHGAAGWEGVVGFPTEGHRVWTTRARASGDLGPWSWGLRLRADDQEPWGVVSRVGYQDWWGGWEGGEGDPHGTVTLGWSHRAHKVAATLGREPGLLGRTEFTLGPVDLGVGASTTGPPRTYGAEVWFEGDRGAWRCGWELLSGTSVVHTVTARWRQSGFELDASWRVEGTSLGWLGPQRQFSLSWRWES